MESIGVLTGGIAHDFNNLLTPILMAAKLLQEERTNEERRHLLKTLRASAKRAAELVRKLLAFAGGMVGERTNVHNDGRESPRSRELSTAPFLRQYSIRTDLAEGLPPVLADATQLSQVLMNLCVNARDAMPSGGTLTIVLDEVTWTRARKYMAHPEARHGGIRTACGGRHGMRDGSRSARSKRSIRFFQRKC